MRDAEVVHAGEVRGAQPPGLVDLSEEDLLGRPFEGPPLFDLPLQGAELAVGEPPREAALQVLEEGLGLEPGIEFRSRSRSSGQTSWNGSSRVRQVLGVNDSLGSRSACRYFASRLGVHTHLQRGKIEGISFAEEPAKLANLGVLDHGDLLLA